MKGFLGTLTVLSLVLFLTMAGIGIYVSYQIDKDILSWQVRAEAVSGREDMLQYMQNVQTGMEEWDMTQGYSALIYKTPENDMGLIYKTVQDHVKNLQLLQEMDPNTPQYQTLIDRLQDSIGDLVIPADAYWNCHDGLVVSIVLWVSIVIFIISGLLLMGMSDLI